MQQILRDEGGVSGAECFANYGAGHQQQHPVPGNRRAIFGQMGQCPHGRALDGASVRNVMAGGNRGASETKRPLLFPHRRACGRNLCQSRGPVLISWGLTDRFHFIGALAVVPAAPCTCRPSFRRPRAGAGDAMRRRHPSAGRGDNNRKRDGQFRTGNDQQRQHAYDNNRQWDRGPSAGASYPRGRTRRTANTEGRAARTAAHPARDSGLNAGGAWRLLALNSRDTYRDGAALIERPECQPRERLFVVQEPFGPYRNGRRNSPMAGTTSGLAARRYSDYERTNDPRPSRPRPIFQASLMALTRPWPGTGPARHLAELHQDAGSIVALALGPGWAYMGFNSGSAGVQTRVAPPGKMRRRGAPVYFCALNLTG